MHEPWINLKDYTLLEFILFFSGAVLWIVAYIAIVRNDFKNKTLSIPIINVCLNFTWEVLCAFIFLPDMGLIIVWGYRAWLVIDCMILYSLFKYGKKQIQTQFLLNTYVPLVLITLVGAFVLQGLFMQEYDLPMSPISAYLINLVMSVCYIGLLFIPNFKGNLKIIGWTKGLGTGLISAMFYLKYPDNYFLLSLYILCAFFDVVYIYLLYNKPVLSNNKVESIKAVN